MQSLRYSLCILAMLFFLAGQAQAAEPAFKQGDKSPDVIVVKLKMREMGYVVGAEDDFYSWRFSQAVKAFQRHQGLKADGVIDRLTYLRIMNKPFLLKPPAQVPDKVKPDRRAGAIILTAKKHLGVPYLFGGSSPKGFDCSGYLQHVFGQHGLKLPRMADAQYSAGKPAAKNSLQPGDLVFFTTYEPGPSHSGLYLGDGEFIHASSSRGVMVSKLSDAYWKARFLGARRVL